MIKKEQLEKKKESCENIIGEYMRIPKYLLTNYFKFIKKSIDTRNEGKGVKDLHKLEKQILSNTKNISGSFLQIETKTTFWGEALSLTCRTIQQYHIINYLRGLTSERYLQEYL